MCLVKMAGVARFLVLVYFLVSFSYVSSEMSNLIDEDVLTTQAFVFWPNATVPFYIDTNHFDQEQVNSLMSALSLFAFKTCLKFAPVLAQPQDEDRVLQFENPTGLRKCEINTEPHNLGEQRRIVLGYDCLHTPEIYMIIMKELGFPFEHNRAVRDLYIDVQTENIEPGYLDLFVKDLRLPVELRSIPYDRNSVLHFGEREYSKNGHKTIIFKDRNFRQERSGLSPIDLRKIDIVYGPECKKRDRQEKIELCQNYPGVARKKREATTAKSLRVNPDITPPPEIVDKDKVEQNVDNNNKVGNDNINNKVGNVDTFKLVEELGIAQEVEELVNQVHKAAGVALLKAREKYCNGTIKVLRAGPETEKSSEHNIHGIIGEVVSYTENLITNAMLNISEFCAPTKPMEDYQRVRTKSGRVVYSTQHRPPIIQSTKHYGADIQKNHHSLYDHLHFRSGANETASVTADDATVGSKKDGANATVVTKPDLRMYTNKIIAHGSVYELRASDDTNSKPEVENIHLTGEAGQVRKKREQPANPKLPNKVITKPKQMFLKSSGNGSKVEKRRYKSRTIRVSTTAKDEDGIWNNYGFSSVNETEAPPLHVVTVPARKRGPASTKPDGLYVQKDSNEDYTTNIVFKDLPYHEAKKERPPDTDSIEPKIIDSIAPSEEEVLISSTKKRHQKLVEPAATLIKGQAGNIHRVKSRPTGHHRLKKKLTSVEHTSKTARAVKTKHHKPAESEQNDGQMRVSYGQITYKGTKKHKSKKKKSKHHETTEAETATTPAPITRTVQMSEKNTEFYNERKWPDNIVRYFIQDTGDFDLEDCRRRLQEVNDILKNQTCVQIEEIPNDSQMDLYEDFLVLDNSPDYVTGRVGGKQIFGAVELLKGGQHRQHAAMMVMAMLGFYFEVARHDRDQYIKVHMRHIRPDKLHHFEKIRQDATFDLPYDYKSATHPAWQFWRHIGRTGISSVATFKEQDPDGSVMKMLGQHEQLLSDYDIMKINSVYGVSCFTDADVRTKDDYDDGLGESNAPPEEIAPKEDAYVKELEKEDEKEEAELVQGDEIE